MRGFIVFVSCTNWSVNNPIDFESPCTKHFIAFKMNISGKTEQLFITRFDVVESKSAKKYVQWYWQYPTYWYRKYSTTEKGHVDVWRWTEDFLPTYRGSPQHCTSSITRTLPNCTSIFLLNLWLGFSTENQDIHRNERISYGYRHGRIGSIVNRCSM